MSAHTHRGIVYFIARGPYVKIGYTSGAIEKRIAALRNQPGLSPSGIDQHDSIWLMHTIPRCVMRDESRVHSLFLRHHAKGEWFHLTPAFIEQLTGIEYVTYAEELLSVRRARADLRQLGFNAYARNSDKPGHGPIGLRLLNADVAA